MKFAREFFDLQFSFAEKVRAVSGMPLERALFEYTNLYVRFGLGREFDFDHVTWQAYLTGLRGEEDGRAWTYRFYLKEPETTTAPPLVATFGCFSYAFTRDDHVRLHFQNAEATGHSPLGHERVDQRRGDLAALFAHLKPTVREDISILGASWLYNLEAYCRLFPAGYAASVRPIRGGFRSMPLWGQFLDYRGRLKESMTNAFVRSLAKHSSLARLEECFPFQVLTASAPASEFYSFYGV